MELLLIPGGIKKGLQEIQMKQIIRWPCFNVRYSFVGARPFFALTKLCFLVNIGPLRD